MEALVPSISFFFFFNDTATTEIYTLSVHDALPISPTRGTRRAVPPASPTRPSTPRPRSEEHTSELQSPCNLVCRLLLEKKKTRQVATSTLLTTTFGIALPVRKSHPARTSTVFTAPL